MMTNPMKKQFVTAYIWQSREHRLRAFAIFMIPKLVHFNDKAITEREQKHSQQFHQYLGPIDCQLAKFKSLPDTDDIRKILPIHIRDDLSDFVEVEARDEADRLDEALRTVNISQYYKNYSIYNNEMKFTGNNTGKEEMSKTSDDSIIL